MSLSDTLRYSRRALRRRNILAGALALLATLLLGISALAAPTPQQDDEYIVYLPQINNGKATPGPTPPPPPNGGSFFVTTQVRTNSAGMAIDRAGGMHMVFTTFVSAGENPPAIYAYCAPRTDNGCADPDTWQAVALSQQVDEVQLALTPAGKPRLLIRKLREGFNSNEYVYAECNASNCTEQSNWSSTVVVQPGGIDTFGKDNPQRYFALDPQGRPRFVYSYGWDGTGHPVGVYYAACNSACTNAGAWSHTPIYEGPQYKSLAFDFPALAFTKAGQPRVVANMTFSGEGQGVYYLACDSGCDDLSGWQALLLGQRGGGVSASWDIELDADDRPHIAFYQAGFQNGSGDRLYYLVCDGDCLNELNWTATDLGLPALVGRNADLELDKQGRPRIAYSGALPNVLAYGWCNTQCEIAGQWQHRTIDTNATLDQQFKPDKPLNCHEQSWTDAIPSLALDGTGNPRVAYDALNAVTCYYDQGPGKPPGSRVEKLWRAVRVQIFKQP